MNFVQQINDYIEAKRDTYIKISDQIWDLAETRFEEHQSADVLCQALENEGFKVERGVGGVETAFTGTFGSGKPVIGILGEFDALSGMSQKAGSTTYEPLEEKGNGHGCGHNLLGTAPLAAVIAVKQYMEENNVSGTIKYYGCPGEEGGSGKTFMAREGAFDDIDCALTWHPHSTSGVFTLSTLANYQVYFTFKGVAAHAANSPHLGRSALDAVELMNVGVNYLREHIIPEARVHYSITNTGGFSPNVVQSEAQVLYLIRAPHMKDVRSIYERVVNIAKGAALMTETKVEVTFDKACSNYIPNNALGQVLHNHLENVGLAEYNEEEMNYAVEIRKQISDDDVSNALNEMKKVAGSKANLITRDFATKTFNDLVVPYEESNGILFGSSDVGDVSWIVPTAQFFGECFVMGTPLHSWQLVSQGRTSIAHKGMLQAGKVLANTALDLFLRPEVIEDAKVELEEKLDGNPYECPIPNGVKPSPLA